MPNNNPKTKKRTAEVVFEGRGVVGRARVEVAHAEERVEGACAYMVVCGSWAVDQVCLKQGWVGRSTGLASYSTLPLPSRHSIPHAPALLACSAATRVKSRSSRPFTSPATKSFMAVACVTWVWGV